MPPYLHSYITVDGGSITWGRSKMYIPSIKEMMNEIERIENMNHKGKILIMVDENDPNKVIAKNLITGETAEAQRNPKDDWDFETGAKLAFERLIEKLKHWTGKVVCIDYSGCGNLTVGKVYDVVNGRLIDDYNNPNYPYISGIDSIKDLNARCERAKFIEYKGGAEE